MQLLAEGVEKNTSLSARRAWIEISTMVGIADHTTVALRKESVDRNCCIMPASCLSSCRSPQGERG